MQVKLKRNQNKVRKSLKLGGIILFSMENPDQKIILLEKAYEEIKVICNNFQDESGASDMEVKTLLRELARVWEKDIDEDIDIDWEV